MSEGLEKTDKKIAELRKQEEEESQKKSPEEQLGSRKAPPARTALDPDKNKYEPKMYRRDGNYPPNGKITIVLYPHKEYETTFEGNITGGDVNRAWKMMIRGYRLWKVAEGKRIEKEKAEAAKKKPSRKKKVEVNR